MQDIDQKKRIVYFSIAGVLLLLGAYAGWRIFIRGGSPAQSTGQPPITGSVPGFPQSGTGGVPQTPGASGTSTPPIATLPPQAQKLLQLTDYSIIGPALTKDETRVLFYKKDGGGLYTVDFDAKSVDLRHKKWLKSIERRIGLRELNPQPYWGFDDLEHKAGTKLLNSFYVQAEVRRIRGREHYRYSKVMMLQQFNFEGFLRAIEQAKVLVDFDARTGHNHGTKFRMRQNTWPMLYEKVTVIF